jgi:hypothetical protein
MMKTFLAILLLTSTAYAGDIYRTMVVNGASKECALVFENPTWMVMKNVLATNFEYRAKAQVLTVSYAMPGDLSAASIQAVHDMFSGKITAACGKGFDSASTIQKGDKLTTASDAKAVTAGGGK